MNVDVDLPTSLDMAKAKQLAVQLSNESDELNRQIGLVEDMLKEIGFGVPAWIRCNDAVSFGYGKINGKWRIGIMSPTDTWPFSESPRELRVECIALIPALLAELVRVASELTERMQAANQTLREMVALLELEWEL
jgi:hypothetical protein